MKARLLLLASLLSGAIASAQTRTSPSYSITAEAADGGGRSTAGGLYAMNGSIGMIGGISSIAAPAETVKSGYIAQLYNITGLQVTAPAQSVNENQTFQLGAIGLLDDGTLLALNPSAVHWSIQSGPIATITGGGLATAGVVFADSPAAVAGGFAGLSGSVWLTVTNAGFDTWQLQYFGLGNPSTAAGVDADGTGQTNLFKYIAGLNPLNPASRFIVAISPAPNQPGQTAVTFSPVATGRTYTVEFCTDLAQANWQTLTGATQSQAGNAMTIIDPNPASPQKFYRVLISY